jgi:hypothetical protein
MADENKPSDDSVLREAEQKYSDQRTRIERAQREILGPAIRAMRDQGLDNQQIAATLELAGKVLREHNATDAS